jgi:predicted component of type VI protein secretion system
MSKYAVYQFFNAVKDNKTLQAEMEDCPTEEAFTRTAVRLGARRGFIFSTDEVRDALRENEASGELSDDALAGVSGGAGDWWLFFNPRKPPH